MEDQATPFDLEIEAQLKAVGAASDGRFSSLVVAAGLDPREDFRCLNLSGADFTGSDLRGYDFTGSDLSNSIWKLALYDETTVFDGACLNNIVGLDEFGSEPQPGQREAQPQPQPQPQSQPTERPRSELRSLRIGGRQTTLGARATVSGIGVHSGLPVTLTLHPADPGTGVVFVRLDAQGRPEREIRAHMRYVTATELATVLGDDESGPCIASIEHVMAALCGLGVDNTIIEIDGPEAPIMDGSAAAYVAAIDQAGIVALDVPRRFTRVLKPIRLSKGEAYGELMPYDRGLRVDVAIDFAHPVIGQQSIALEVEPTTFRRELARARTFGFMKDVSKLWSAGYALGASLENTLVVADDRLLNPEGLRYADEFVRHKALDAIGDLALAGAPLLGAYKSVRGGHKLNHAILCALIADPTAWTVVEAAEVSSRDRRSWGGLAGLRKILPAALRG